MLKRIWKVMKGMAKANVWCILFDCDWEEVSHVTENFAINNLLEAKFRKYAKREQDRRNTFLRGIVPPGEADRELTQNICLRCCEVQDKIQEYLADCRALGYKEMEKERRKVRRQEKAKYMLKNCGKGKFKKIFK